ncbi:MAG: type II secretion system protein [Phycisphaerae bacterium]
MNRKAFTLIELLVVISIIALLVSILVPSLAAARDMARQVRCITNMRGIGQAVALYAEDNNNFWPRSSMTATMNPPMAPFKVRPWGEAIVRYIGSNNPDFSRLDNKAASIFAWLFTGMYRCPSDATHINENWTYDPDQLYLGHWSYGKNVLLEYNVNWDPKYGEFYRMDVVPRPSSTVLFGEITANQMSDHFMVDEWLDDGSNTTVAKTRHRSQSNYIFCDTHAVPAVFRTVFDPPNGTNNFDPKLAR